MNIALMKKRIPLHIAGKFLVIIIICFLEALLGGCKKMENNKLYLKKYSYKTEKISNEVANEIVEAAKDKDSQMIKGLFSEYVLKKNNEIDSQIENFVNYCDYTTSDIEVCTNIKESRDPQKNYHYLFIMVECSFTDLDGEKYRLYFEWIADDTDNESKIGINAIYIIKESNFQEMKNKDWGIDDKSGVYIIE